MHDAGILNLSRIAGQSNLENVKHLSLLERTGVFARKVVLATKSQAERDYIVAAQALCLGVDIGGVYLWNFWAASEDNKELQHIRRLCFRNPLQAARATSGIPTRSHLEPIDSVTICSRRDSGFALHRLDPPIILDHKSIYASIKDFQLEPQMRPITEEEERQEGEEQILDIDPEHNYINSLGDKLETELAREDPEPIIRQKIIRTTIYPLRPTMTPIPEHPEEEEEVFCVCPEHIHDATNSVGDISAAPVAAGKLLDNIDSVARDTTVAAHAAPVAAGKFETTNNPHSPLGIFVDPKSPITSPLLEFKSLKELKTSTDPGTDDGNGGNGGVVSGPFEPPGGGDWRGHSPPIPPSLLGLPKNKMGEWWRRRKAWFKKQRGDLKKLCRKLKRRK
ncbi:hypothetical protein V8F06_010527 [Rhypophila decipiens]